MASIDLVTCPKLVVLRVGEKLKSEFSTLINMGAYAAQPKKSLY